MLQCLKSVSTKSTTVAVSISVVTAGISSEAKVFSVLMIVSYCMDNPKIMFEKVQRKIKCWLSHH